MNALNHLSIKSLWLCAVALGLAFSTTGQTFTTIKNFGGPLTGLRPNSQLTQGPNGMLYGTTARAEGDAFGTIFKMQPDGSGFITLKWFTNWVEAAVPCGNLALSGNMLYGMTRLGGTSGSGTVFKVNTDGTDFQVLKHLIGGENHFGGGVIISGEILYGTTYSGGSADRGTVFRINTDGTGFQVLKDFTQSDDPRHPAAPLTLSGNTLYGTTRESDSGYGAIFKVNTDGTGYAVLKSLAYNEAGEPFAGLALSGDVLYGTSGWGGSWGSGTVFKIKTDGTGYTVLKDFSQTNFDPTIGSSTNSDGAGPVAALTLLGSVLYGTTYSGGSAGYGTAFQINTDGTVYTVLKHFAYGSGVKPEATLTLVGNIFYGTTCEGGGLAYGTAFKMNADGTGYAVVKNFGFSDGWGPAEILISGSTLYGTTAGGGSSDSGTVFKINTDSTEDSVLKNFSKPLTRDPVSQSYTNADGEKPVAGLTLANDVLYGTTQYGGGQGNGVVFKVNASGSGYSVLKTFTGTNRYGPAGRLTLSGNTLYGTTRHGGSGAGTVFKVNTDSTGYSVLKGFIGADGRNPVADLSLSGNTLYGITYGGGKWDSGTVFKVNTDGTGYSVLKDFTRIDYDPVTDRRTNSDGILPSGLTLSGTRLYGTACEGGSSGSGTLFTLKTDGTGYVVLKQFTKATCNSPTGTYTNIDGALPYAGLTLSGNVMYGTTYVGGNFGYGTIFQMNIDGTGYLVLKHFAYTDGANPSAILALSGNTLYGTTTYGGSWRQGTVFKLELAAPSLSVQTLSDALVLSWNNPAFVLQAAPEVTGPFTSIPGATNPYTSTVSETQRFFRLVGSW
jgi:uncharacterized repeat protein (TIGR03803 family)